MIDDNDLFVTLETNEGGVMIFGDNDKDHIIGIGKAQLTSLTSLENVLYVRGLKYNLISTSQLCDKGLKVSFELSLCLVTNPLDNSNIFTDHRQDNMYLIDMDNININGHCIVASKANIDEDS